MFRHVLCLGVALSVIAVAAPSARADEGMWTFDNFPTERMRETYGWAPDQAWLDRVMQATARLDDGCSGAVVSGQGLVLTNHHCVSACLDALFATNARRPRAFTAALPAEEARCTGLDIRTLDAIEDVTARINAAAANASPETFAAARDAEIARIESACAPSTACEVVTLYQGARFALYRYKTYADVRLVFAPEEEAAYFGGDADNFSFPRHCLDLAFLRLYENGAPAATPKHLSMRFTPLTDGEIAFVSGSPGSTERQMTTTELAFQRDLFLPWRIRALTALRARLADFTHRGAYEQGLAGDYLLTVENSLKALAGRRAALADPEVMMRTRAIEEDLQARVRRNLAAQRAVGNAWAEIATTQIVYSQFALRHQLLETRAGGGSNLFAYARALVRNDAVARDAMLSNAWPDQALEQVVLAAWLADLRDTLGANDATVRALLAAETPDTLAAKLAASRLADPSERHRLWNADAATRAASTDPMLVFARSFDEAARALESRYQREIAAPVAQARERIAQARFRAFEEGAYPEATFTARLSYGRIAGWSEPDGRVIAPFTQFDGLFARATGAPNLTLAPSWSAARARLEPATQFNVASDNDITGGNSGSPLIDRDGRVIGVVFDGNAYSVSGEYVFDAARNRAVSLAAPAIRAALADVYRMDTLVRELETQTPSP